MLTAPPLPAPPQVDFWVWDSGSPARSANINRTVAITNPCPDADKPYTCAAAGAASRFCSGVPCEQLSRFVPSSSSSPRLTLLPSSQAVFVEYKSAAPFYLGPCSSAAAAQQGVCGAVASDGSSGTTRDLTSDIVVTDVTTCSTDGTSSSSGSSPACIACSVEALTLGRCLPGAYTFQYSVTGGSGRAVAVNRTVVVYQRGEVNATLTVLTSDNATVAEQLRGELRNISSAAYAAAVRGMQDKLAPAGVEIGGADVDITGATVRVAASLWYCQ